MSRAYAGLMLGLALVGHGEHVEAGSLLERVVTELEGFGFPQWHALALCYLAEVRRVQRRLDEGSSLVERGLEIATRAEYWFAVGMARRVAGRIARDRGRAEEATAAFTGAFATFERIGADFEATRTRRELAAIV